MLEKYFKYFTYLMQWSYFLESNWRKGDLHVYRYDVVKLAILNDYENRRVIVFIFHIEDRKIYRVAYHGYHAKYLRYKLMTLVAKVRENPTFWEDKLIKRRSYSFKSEQAGARKLRGKR